MISGTVPLIIRADWRVINIYGTVTRSSRMLSSALMTMWRLRYVKPRHRWDFMHRTIFVSPDLIILTRLASTHPALQLWDISGKKLLTMGWMYSCGSGQGRMYPNTISPERKCCGRRAAAVERAAAGMPERI